jgi:hypothetical protein
MAKQMSQSKSAAEVQRLLSLLSQVKSEGSEAQLQPRKRRQHRRPRQQVYQPPNPAVERPKPS